MRLDLTSLASVLLLLSFYVVLIYHPAEPKPGLVALHKTPLTDCRICVNVPDHTRITACLTADGRTSFTASDAELQAITMRQTGLFFSQPALTETQLLTCLITAQLLSPAMSGRPAYLYLAIDADASAAAVMHLLHYLRQHNLNRFNLVTHCRA